MTSKSRLGTQTIIARCACWASRASCSRFVHCGPHHISTNGVVADDELFEPPTILVICGSTSNSVSFSPYNLGVVANTRAEFVRRNVCRIESWFCHFIVPSLDC